MSTALERRMAKLEGRIGAADQFNPIIHCIEPGTMRVTSRLRLIPGGGSMRVDDDGNEIDACPTALAVRQCDQSNAG